MKKENLEQLLVLQAKNGNAEALNTLLEANKNYIYAIAFALLKNKEDAEDAMQQALITVWHSINTLENTEAFESWLYRIAHTRSMNILKSRKNSEIIIDSDIADDPRFDYFESELMLPQEYAERNDLKERLFQIIDSLSAVQRETIVLHYFHDKAVSEIAEIMDCSQGTVKSRLYLARNTIKSEIEEQERKSGEKFFGVAIGTLPMGKFIADSVNHHMLLPDELAKIFYSAQRAVSMHGNADSVNIANGAKQLSKTAGKKSISLAAKIAIASVGAVAVVGAGVLAANTIFAPKQEDDKNAVEETTVAQTTAQTPTQPTTEIPTEETTQPPTEPDYSEAYKAYKDVLEESLGEIKAYNWQFDDTEARPIVFADIIGDETPELIYAYSDNSNGNSSAYMNIYTYSNGDCRLIYPQDEPFFLQTDIQQTLGYFFFQPKDEKNLYISYYKGISAFQSYRVYKLTEDNNQYSLDLLVNQDYLEAPVLQKDGEINGQDVGYDEAGKYRDELLDSMANLLMYNGKNPQVYQKYLSSENNQAMTYGEAINFLSQFDTSSQQTDFSVIAGKYFTSISKMYICNLEIFSDGTFICEIGGGPSDDKQYSLCRGKIADLKREGEYTYTFHVKDTELDNEPGTKGYEFVDGRFFTVTYSNNHFITEDMFTFYSKGILTSELSEEARADYTWTFKDIEDKPTKMDLILLPDGSVYFEGSR